MNVSPSPGPKRYVHGFFLVLWVFWAVWLICHYFGHAPLLVNIGEELQNDFWAARPSRAWVAFCLFLKTLLLDLAFMLVCWAWGRRFGRLLGLPGKDPMVPVLETALGLAGVELFWVGWGLNRLWREEVVFSLALLALGVALWDAAQWVLFKKRNVPFLNPSNAFNWMLGGFCLLMALFSLGQAALPDIYFDSLSYHLYSLRNWSQANGFTPLPSNLYTAFPFGGEMDFLGAFRWGSGEAVKGLNAFALILLALAAGIWAWEEGGRNAAFLAAGLALGFPLAVTGTMTAQVDVLQALFTLLFYYSLNQGSKSKHWFWCAGIMAGAALAVKYTALLGLGVGLLFWGGGLFSQTRKKPARLLGLLVPPVFLFLPWILKNWAYTANPLYPYFGSWFAGHGLPADQMAQLMRDHVQAFGPGETFSIWMQRVFTRDLDNTVAPLLFSFLPLLILAKGAKGRSLKILSAGGLSLVLGLAVSHQLRLGLGALMVCFVGMSLFAEQNLAPGLRKAWKGVLLVLLVLNFIGAMRWGFLYYEDGRIWCGAETRGEYLTQHRQTETYYPLAQDSGHWFARSENLLVAGDARGLYYPVPVITNSVFDVQVMAGLARSRQDGDGIALALREMGVDGLVVLREEGIRLAKNYNPYPLSEGEWKRLDDFIQRHTRLLELTPLGGIYCFSPEPLTGKAPVPDLFLCFKAPSGL